MVEEISLKPCPFCGEKENLKFVKLIELPEHTPQYIQCQNCSGNTQHGKDKQDAVIKWNTRIVWKNEKLNQRVQG